MKNLPAELVGRILGFVDAREPGSHLPSRDILHVCLTSRALCVMARPFIYRRYDMYFDEQRPFKRFALFARTLDESPHLAPLVKSMTAEWQYFDDEDIKDRLKDIAINRQEDDNYDKSVLWQCGASPDRTLAAHFRYLFQRILRCTRGLRSVALNLNCPMPAVPDDEYWSLLDGLDPSQGPLRSLTNFTYWQDDVVDTIIMWRLLHALGRVAPNIKQLNVEAFDMDVVTGTTSDAAARSPALSFPALTHLLVGQSSLDLETGVAKLLAGCGSLESFFISEGRETGRYRERKSLTTILGLLLPHRETLWALILNLHRDRDDEAFLLQPALEPFTKLQTLILQANSEVMKREAERLTGNYWAHRRQCSL